MREFAQTSPLLLCLIIVLVGAVSSLLPMSPVEPVLIAVAAVAPTWLLVPIIVLVTVSHMSTKMLVFLGGRKVNAGYSGRGRDHFDRARLKLSGHPRLQHGTLFLSSVTGLPPFYVITVLCGTLRMPVREFLVLATTGRAIRFAVLVFAPQLFRPAVAAAQTIPPAVRVVGDGSPTYVLVSGMVGGVAGFRRLETRLAAQGARVVSVDPYQLVIDSADVSFDAMARVVNAELERRGIAGAVVVGHSHGGGVALRLAANAPSRVAALYLLDVGALPSNQSVVFGSAIRLAPIISRLPAGKRFIEHRLIAGLRENASRSEWIDDSTRCRYARPLVDNIDRVVAMAIRLGSAAEPEPVSAVLERVHAPVTVLLGEVRTRAGPSESELAVLRRLGRNFRLDTVRGAGHFPHEESPDDVARLLRRPAVVAIRSGTIR